MKQFTDTYTLSNGVKIPVLGYGTWQTPDDEAGVEAITYAIQDGYRLIDTAACYQNEKSVGQAVRFSGVPREKLFITSKVWNTDRGYEKTIRAFEKTLNDLGLAYLDLYLIHWPASASRYDNWEEINLSTWHAMMDLYKAGKIRAIGVSNFKPHHLKALMETEIPPMVDQIEYHPGMNQEETVSYCKEHGILVEAWSPLGRNKLFDNPLLNEIAAHTGHTAAQVMLRRCIDKDIIPLPKSVTPSRIRENRNIFDFDLSPEDMKAIDTMPDTSDSSLDPDRIDF